MIQKPRTRYFLIMFSGINKQRQPVSATIEYPGKAYPSKEKIMAHIKREYGCEEYYLRNILELNREDFESYTGEPVESFDAANDRITQEWMDTHRDKGTVLTKEIIMNNDIQSPHEFMRAKNPEAEGCGA